MSLDTNELTDNFDDTLRTYSYDEVADAVNDLSDLEESGILDFFVVISPLGFENAPTRYKNAEDAENEASRLAHLNPGEMFFVSCSYALCKTVGTVPVVHYLDF